MKEKIKIGIVMCTVFLTGTLVAQETDTVKVIKETHIIKETQVVRDTVKQIQIIHDSVPKENNQTKKAELRRGEFGVRYMPTFASLALRTYNGDVIQGDMTMNNGYAIMLGFNISKNIGIQTEINYLEITQKYKDQNLNRQVSVTYLNIPAMLSINTDKSRILNLNFVAGPQFGINIGSSIKTTGDENSETLRAVVGASGTDIGLAYGTGLELALTRSHRLRLDLGYRGFYGLVDVSSKQYSNNPDTYNVLVRTARKTNAAYMGLTLCF